MYRVARVSNIWGVGYDLVVVVVVVVVACIWESSLSAWEAVGRSKFSWHRVHFDIKRYDVGASSGPSPQ